MGSTKCSTVRAVDIFWYKSLEFLKHFTCQMIYYHDELENGALVHLD